MTFAEPATVSSSQVYWFDDTGRGELAVHRLERDILDIEAHRVIVLDHDVVHPGKGAYIG